MGQGNKTRARQAQHAALCPTPLHYFAFQGLKTGNQSQAHALTFSQESFDTQPPGTNKRGLAMVTEREHRYNKTHRPYATEIPKITKVIVIPCTLNDRLCQNPSTCCDFLCVKQQTDLCHEVLRKKRHQSILHSKFGSSAQNYSLSFTTTNRIWSSEFARRPRDMRSGA